MFQGLMHSSLRQGVGLTGRVLTARVLALLCCLLVVQPALSVRVLVQCSMLLESTEEPRQTSEEERATEDLIAPRSHGRRTHEEFKSSPPLACHRGGNHCGRSAGRGHATLHRSASTRGEHHLRNGVGAPLRC